MAYPKLPELSAFLKETRKKLKIDLRDLELILNRSWGTLSAYESPSGVLHPTILASFCKVYCLNYSEVIEQYIPQDIREHYQGSLPQVEIVYENTLTSPATIPSEFKRQRVFDSVDTDPASKAEALRDFNNRVDFLRRMIEAGEISTKEVLDGLNEIRYKWAERIVNERSQ